jgi:hypothetical protein
MDVCLIRICKAAGIRRWRYDYLPEIQPKTKSKRGRPKKVENLYNTYFFTPCPKPKIHASSRVRKLSGQQFLPRFKYPS